MNYYNDYIIMVINKSGIISILNFIFLCMQKFKWLGLYFLRDFYKSGVGLVGCVLIEIKYLFGM